MIKLSTPSPYAMGLFGRLLRRKTPPPCSLEVWLDKLGPRALDRQVRIAPEDLRAGTAIALAILTASGAFAKGLRKAAGGVPEFMRTDKPFPFEKSVAEAAGLFHCYMSKDHLKRAADDQADDSPIDPFFESLKVSIHVCGSLIGSLSEGRVSEKFVAGRVATYSDVCRRGGDILGSMHASLLRAWGFGADGRSSLNLDLAAPDLLVQAAIASMPLDDVRKICEGLHRSIAGDSRTS